MAQEFKVMYWGHLDSDPYKQFVWHEDDNGDEKYGFLYSSSVSGCLNQIKNEIHEDEFEIDIHLSDNHGGSCVITTMEDLESAKLKYTEFANNSK